MMRQGRIGRIWGVLVAAAMVVGVGGCSLNPSEMASSVRSSGSGKTLKLQFANTLNMPEGADVTLNGLRVGSVKDVVLRRGYVDVTATLDDVRISADATASIRQSTVLGDPYVSIRASGTGPSLTGGTIPLSGTISPPALEDTLVVLANFVNAGSIQDMQEVIRSVNAALPEIKQTQRVANIAAVDLKSLAKDTSRIDTMIEGLDKTSRTIIPRLPKIEKMFNPDGMHYWDQMSRLFGNIGIVLPSIGSVFEGGFWLVPMLNSVNNTADTLVGMGPAIADNDALIRKFLTENLQPFMKKPGLDIVSMRTPEGQNVISEMLRVLKMLGAMQ